VLLRKDEVGTFVTVMVAKKCDGKIRFKKGHVIWKWKTMIISPSIQAVC
jgi:hypothetical protein